MGMRVHMVLWSDREIEEKHGVTLGPGRDKRRLES